MASAPRKYAPILGGFVPFAALWDERGKGIFPSETSARWFVRGHREQLVEAQAIALHVGRLFIHPERFETVAQRVAIHQAGRALVRGSSTGAPTT